MIDDFTSTGSKFWNHPEALEGLRNGRPRPVVSHLMLTDVCNHRCAFCSVQSRAGDALTIEQIDTYLNQLVPLGLKAVILSGGGNPILFKDFNELVDNLHNRGLEIGLITNGMPLKPYRNARGELRRSWKNVDPETLDKLTWIRISCSGLDHPEKSVSVPDIDQTKTTLGFSYVYHDIYEVPCEPHHGKVSTEYDLIQLGGSKVLKSLQTASSRFDELVCELQLLVERYNPKYIRLLPNCLEPEKISARCEELQRMAELIDPRVFVQYKPPAAPKACYLGYLHPVLNTDGYVYPCDSCVLNQAAGHKFANPWRVARWDTIGELYSRPASSLVDAPNLCPGCVFTRSNELLIDITENGRRLELPQITTHPNFV